MLKIYSLVSVTHLLVYYESSQNVLQIKDRQKNMGKFARNVCFVCGFNSRFQLIRFLRIVRNILRHSFWLCDEMRFFQSLATKRSWFVYVLRHGYAELLFSPRKKYKLFPYKLPVHHFWFMRQLMSQQKCEKSLSWLYKALQTCIITYFTRQRSLCFSCRFHFFLSFAYIEWERDDKFRIRFNLFFFLSLRWPKLL